jgi:hypothetical protein
MPIDHPFIVFRSSFPLYRRFRFANILEHDFVKVKKFVGRTRTPIAGSRVSDTKL